MRRISVVGFAFAFLLCMHPVLARAHCAPVQSSALYVREVADQINEQGFQDFRRLSLRNYSTVALSPLLRWHTRYLVAMQKQPQSCTQWELRAHAFMKAFKTVPGRYFVTAIRSGHPFQAKTQLQQRAAIDASFPTGMSDAMKLPYFSNRHGITGVRLDSTTGALSLYLIYATPGITEPLLARFQEELDLKSWKSIVAKFKPEVVSAQPYPLWLSGMSLLAQSHPPVEQYIGLQLKRASIEVFGTSTIKSSVASNAPLVSGTIDPAELILCVLVDRKTGVIIDIGANVAETERK